MNIFWVNFFRTLIRACTGSFANVWTGTTLENIKLGQIFGSWKNGSWALVDARNFFLWFINWEHVQEALEMCQNALLGFGLLLGSRSYYQMLPFLHNELFWVNFFRTLIRACTGSFANVWTGMTLKNIKLGQIFGSWKNGSWALVDARNFFFVIY